MGELTSLTLKAAVEGLKSKRFSSLELTQAHVQAIEAARGLNAFVLETPDKALDMARAELGTTTIKDTVNAALRRATTQRERRVAAALDLLAAAPPEDRAEAWR